MAPKPCTLCATPRQILVRCQTDASGAWHFVCPGKCWHSVSGGVEDARGLEGKPRFAESYGIAKGQPTVSARLVIGSLLFGRASR